MLQRRPIANGLRARPVPRFPSESLRFTFTDNSAVTVDHAVARWAMLSGERCSCRASAAMLRHRAIERRPHRRHALVLGASASS